MHALSASLLAGLCTAAAVGCGGAAPEAPPAVTFEQKDQSIDVLLSGQRFTAFHYGDKWDKPFLYPLTTASGIVISRGWPIEPREGETGDHAWHRGIWYGHGDVNGQDFWREQGRDKTSTLVPKAPPAVSGHTISVELSMLTPAKESLGTIEEAYTFSSERNLRIVDAVIEIRADEGKALELGDTEDGGFAFRLSDAFREDQGGRTANAEGLVGTENIWGKASKWTDYSAAIHGKLVGAAIFDHPSNFRHPTTWHARGYSLDAANPFGSRSFTGDKTQDGSHTIPAGESLTFRYRVVIYEGMPGEVNVEELYRRYAP